MLIIEDSDEPLVYELGFTYDSRFRIDDFCLTSNPLQYRCRCIIPNQSIRRQREVEDKYEKGIKVNPLKNLISMIKRKFK